MVLLDDRTLEMIDIYQVRIDRIPRRWDEEAGSSDVRSTWRSDAPGRRSLNTQLRKEGKNISFGTGRRLSCARCESNTGPGTSTEAVLNYLNYLAYFRMPAELEIELEFGAHPIQAPRGVEREGHQLCSKIRCFTE